jgi:hypothetical protein
MINTSQIQRLILYDKFLKLFRKNNNLTKRSLDMALANKWEELAEEMKSYSSTCGDEHWQAFVAIKIVDETRKYLIKLCQERDIDTNYLSLGEMIDKLLEKQDE